VVSVAVAAEVVTVVTIDDAKVVQYVVCWRKILVKPRPQFLVSLDDTPPSLGFDTFLNLLPVCFLNSEKLENLKNVQSTRKMLPNQRNKRQPQLKKPRKLLKLLLAKLKKPLARQKQLLELTKRPRGLRKTLHGLPKHSPERPKLMHELLKLMLSQKSRLLM
jgi:hypothetical protein